MRFLRRLVRLGPRVVLVIAFIHVVRVKNSAPAIKMIPGRPAMGCNPAISESSPARRL